MNPSFASILATLSELQANIWQEAETQSANGQHSLAVETSARATGAGQALEAVKSLAIRTRAVKSNFEKRKQRAG